MARSVTFNGITQFRPGGISKVDASALAQIGLSTNGIIGLIGEADGGTPLEVYQIDDPAVAKEIFRSGPLADAIRLAFDPSDDPRVPGGAFRCLCVKANNTSAAQSEAVVYQKVRQSAATLDDTSTGASTPLIVTITTGGLTVDAHIGNLCRVTFAASNTVEFRPITDNTANTVTVAPGFTVAPQNGDLVEFLAPMGTITTRDYGVHTAGNTLEYEPGVNVGQAWTSQFEGNTQLSDDIGGRSYFNLEYIGNRDEVVQVSGVDDGSDAGLNTIAEAGAFVLNAEQNRFVEADDTGALDVVNIRKIASNTTGVLTTTNNFTTVAGVGTNPGAATLYRVLTGQIHGGVSALLSAASAGTASLETSINVAANELAGLVIEIVDDTNVAAEGQRRTITSNTAFAAGPTAAVLTLDQNWDVTPSVGAQYALYHTVAADATIFGANGIATGLTTRLQLNEAASPTQDLNITFTQGQTINDLVAAINSANPLTYNASVPSGINGLVEVASFDHGIGEFQVDIRTSPDAVATAPSPNDDPPTPWNNRFRRDLQEFVNSLNTISEQFTMERSTAASWGAGQSRPEFSGGSAGTPGDGTVIVFTGGTRGTSTNTNWQSAFDLLLPERHQAVVALIAEDQANLGYGSTATYASVAAQLASHVSQRAGIEKNEAGGYIGFKGTLAQLTAQANVFNNPDIQICSQTQQVLDVDGNLVTQPAWASAVIAAGMRAGMPEVGEPLTHKYFRTAEMDQDSSWDPATRGDANLLIKNGVLFAETIRGKGTRWVRDLTTYVQDDNLAFAEGSVRDVVRYVSYELRTFLEDRFTGIKNSPATATSIKESAAAILEVMRSNNIIVDSTDSDGNVVRAYHNMRVTISGDIATIRVSIFPAVGINFQLTSIHLQLPTQSA